MKLLPVKYGLFFETEGKLSLPSIPPSEPKQLGVAAPFGTVPDALVSALLSLVRKSWVYEVCPSEWKMEMIGNVRKKGGRLKHDDCKGIENKEQAIHRSGSSCARHVNTLDIGSE